jgi:glucokinase
MMPKKCAVGVDLGGTNVRARVYYNNGKPASPRYQNLSFAQHGEQRIVKALVEIITNAINNSQTEPEAIGIAIPGHVDNENGVIFWAPNFGKYIKGVFYDWQNIPIRVLLQKHFNIPIFIGNDANLAALGEYCFGSGKNSARCLVMLTVGSGIGSGIILSPHAVDGSASGPLMLVGGNKGGAEMGHICINMHGLESRAGLYGTLESYCQKDSIVSRAVHKLKHNTDSIIHKLVRGDLDKVSPRILSMAASQNDETAIDTFREIGTFLGYGIGNCINIFAPDILAIGGQISKAGDWLLKPAMKQAQKVAIPTLFSATQITLAEKLDDAGMLGAAVFAIKQSQN